MTKEEFNHALAKADNQFDFMALANKLGNNDQRIMAIIIAAYWRGYAQSTKNAIKAIEREDLVARGK